MIDVFLLTAALQAAPDKPLKFGAYLEQVQVRGDLEWIAYHPDGPLFVPWIDGTSRMRAMADTRDGRWFSTTTGEDQVRVAGNDSKSTTIGSRGNALGQLHRPGGLDFDPRGEGRLLVADTLNHRVAVFALDGKPLSVFGRLGAGDGQLNHPHDVAVDASGAVFVADAGNDRVVKFDADGKFVKAFGGRGTYPSQFRHPTGLDVHGERVYVADRDNHRVQVFDLAGAFVYEWGVGALLPREGDGKLHDPSDVAVSPDGTRVAVIEPMEDRIQIFGPARDDTLMTSPEGDTGVHFGGFPSVRRDVFAVANPAGPYVSIFDLTIGTPVEITKFGRPGQMRRPVSVLLDEKAERVYVADPYAYTISAYRIARKADEPLRFDPFLARFERSVDLRAGSAVSLTWPIEPAGMTLGKDGEVLVADAANRRVVAFDRDLVALRTVQDGYEFAPRGVAFVSDVSGVIVTGGGEVLNPAPPAHDPESMNELLEQLYSSSPGVGSNTAPAQHVVGGAHACGVGVDSLGNMWITDARMSLLTRLPKGLTSGWQGPRSLIWRSGLGRAEFWKPEGVAIDERNRAFVVDTGNHRFQIIDPERGYVDMFGARFYTEAARTPPPGIPPAKAWDGAKSVTTPGRAWRVLWKPRTSPIVSGKPFTVDAWVFEAGWPGQPMNFVDLRLDAYMPEHLHGMNRVPVVTKRDDGGFTIEGVLLHMSGFWELDFDVTHKGVTERAMTRVDLE